MVIFTVAIIPATTEKGYAFLLSDSFLTGHLCLLGHFSPSSLTCFQLPFLQLLRSLSFPLSLKKSWLVIDNKPIYICQDWQFCKSEKKRFCFFVFLPIINYKLICLLNWQGRYRMIMPSVTRVLRKILRYL